MGIVFPTKFKRICAPYDDLSARIIIVGLDSAGKSTIVQRFKNLVELQLNRYTPYIENITTEPTCVFHVETIYPRLAPLPLTLWDLGGHEKIRELWRFYLPGVQGVIFVIDCDDKQRLGLAKEELLNLSEKLGSSSPIPIVIAANKQDLSS
ncbi:hypothetical protein I4U23_013758 [Adineta vaga]|nr:hypothetical protein I4U23_013758 [Adineta vaga]